MEYQNPAAVGYTQKTDYQSFVDEEFIKKNPDSWEIIKLFSDSPFLTQEEICLKLKITKNQLKQHNKKNTRQTSYYCSNNNKTFEQTVFMLVLIACNLSKAQIVETNKR